MQNAVAANSHSALKEAQQQLHWTETHWSYSHLWKEAAQRAADQKRQFHFFFVKKWYCSTSVAASFHPPRYTPTQHLGKQDRILL